MAKSKWVEIFRGKGKGTAAVVLLGKEDGVRVSKEFRL